MRKARLRWQRRPTTGDTLSLHVHVAPVLLLLFKLRNGQQKREQTNTSAVCQGTTLPAHTEPPSVL